MIGWRPSHSSADTIRLQLQPLSNPHETDTHAFEFLKFLRLFFFISNELPEVICCIVISNDLCNLLL
jgi:hypothetical protein